MSGVNPPDAKDHNSSSWRAYHLAARALAEGAGVPHPQGVHLWCESAIPVSHMPGVNPPDANDRNSV